MFYGNNEVNALLKCPQCTKRLETPCMLPCGHTLCSTCIVQDTDIENNTKKFTCNACQEEHVVPDKGFPINEIVLKLLNAQPHEIYRSKAAETLKSHLSEIAARKATLVDMLNRPNTLVSEKCESLRNDIQIATEQFIAKVHECHTSFMTAVDKFEATCMSKMELVVDYQTASLSTKLDEADKFCTEWWKYLDQFDVDDERIAKGVALATDFSSEMKKRELKLNLDLFDNKSTSFVPSELFRDDELIGTLCFLDEDVRPDN